MPATRGLVLGPDEGDPYHWLGTLSITKILGSSTTGNLDVVDHRVPPGFAARWHVHRDADEVFYLIDGDLEVRCGGDAWRAGRDSLVFLPRGVPHGFVNSTDGPARILIFCAPAGFGDLIVALGEEAPQLDLPPADAPVPPPDRIAAVAAAHGICRTQEPESTKIS
ncbi:cupin domain-containing protein [Catenuloplanes atrovinosus]|uniref:Quercetin dioxygenase-like cupin family protein n=1 Tax=Catenuloplanes atrovinosus TaxID=137266 RepID=A0AAE3YNY3_9ACTN|nr:cupin domain-containing protein [Catenuloplanes atrovinosus]MDR7275226.1 quercetin dioxygenase-like cupin family protein [Catenuloplanes atrovinosus]